MPREIQLTRGYVTLVDDEDFEWLSQWKWHAQPDHRTVYAARSVWSNPRQTIRMHREILGAKPGELVDHADQNGLNNQRFNLRTCNKLESSRNRRMRVGASGFIGVTRANRGKPWRATIRDGQGVVRLGQFATPVEAAVARDAAAIALHGLFAQLNFPRDLAEEMAERIRARATKGAKHAA